jgi:hypothetical protein
MDKNLNSRKKLFEFQYIVILIYSLYLQTLHGREKLKRIFVLSILFKRIISTC